MFQLVGERRLRFGCDDRPVRRQEPLQVAVGQQVNRLTQCLDASGEAVIPFGVEPGVHLRAVEHHIAAKPSSPASCRSRSDMPRTVPGGVGIEVHGRAQAKTSPARKCSVERHGLNGRAHVAGAVDRERVIRLTCNLRKSTGFSNEAFGLRGGDLCSVPFNRRSPLALFAVMVREQDPLDVLHADFRQIVEYCRRQRSIKIAASPSRST